jgi:hypothetical protein
MPAPPPRQLDLPAARLPGMVSGMAPGMILAFTLVILVLISLMGVTILYNSRTELSISSNTSMGRNAFASADTAARIAVLIGRILLHPELGPPGAIISNAPGGGGPAFPLDVEINIDELEPDDIIHGYELRYIRSGNWRINDGQGLPGEFYGQDIKPHIIFKKRGTGEIVAAAALSLEQAPDWRGMSLGGGDAYAGDGGAALSLVLAVSVHGRALTFGPGASGSFEGEEGDEARSIITILYREFI